MGLLYDSVIAFVRDIGWTVREHEQQGWVDLGFESDAGAWRVVLQAYEDRGQVAMFSIAPLRVPEERMDAALEFVARANFGLVLGNFEIDVGDGEVRFKTSLDTGGGPLTSQLLAPLVAANVGTMERYLPGIEAVAAGEAADAAVAAVEAGAGADETPA